MSYSITIGNLEVPVVEAIPDRIILSNPDGYAANLVPTDMTERNGLMVLNLTNEHINVKSLAVASICEIFEDNPFLGSGVMKVLNVVPENGGVKILVEIDSGIPIMYRIHLIVYF